MRTFISGLSFVGLLVCCANLHAQNWGTITRGAIHDRFAGSSLANNFTTDADGGSGTLFTQSFVDDAVSPDSFGQGPHDRGLAQAFAGLQFGGNLTPVLKARAVLTGNISNQPPMSGVPVNDARARATANASEILQYTGALATILTLSFTLEGQLVDDPGNTGTYINSQVAVFGETGYFFTTDVTNLLDNGVFPKSFDFTSLQILDDTAGLIATRTAILGFPVNPGEIFYLFAQLDTAADRGARVADAFGTLTAQFDQPELVRSLSIPEPAALALVVLAALGAVLTRSRGKHRWAFAHRGLLATGIVLLVSASSASGAMFNANNVAELISAINSANQNAEPDSIALAAGATFMLTEVNNTTHGSTGLPRITANETLTILGNGAVIERNAATEIPTFRLFDIDAEASLTLENVTLQGGLTDLISPSGGAIYNAGTLALVSVTVQNNVALGKIGSPCTFQCGGPGGIGWTGLGGGIYSVGSLHLENTVLRNNQAEGGPGGFGVGGRGRGGDGRGGGLFVSAGSAALYNSLVSGNSAVGGFGSPSGSGYGGGIYVSNAQVDLDEFTFGHVAGNSASTNYPNIFGPFEVIPDLNPVPGDFDLDNDVDGSDFLKWQRGESSDPLSSADLADWETNYGTDSTPLAAATGAVPEPACRLLAAALFALLATRHSRL